MTRRKGEPLTNVAASVKARLLQKARAGDEDFNALVTRFVLERLLYRITRSIHSNEFILKGALLFVVWSGKPHRATKDIDLLGYGSPDPGRLQTVFRTICETEVPDDGVVFYADTVKAEPIREESLYDGIRLRFIAELGTGRIPVQVDVGFGDETNPSPEEEELPVLLDYPAPRIRVYARESTIAEKLHAIVDLGLSNSRMKDYYDIWFLSKFYSFDGGVLTLAVRATFDKRGTIIPELVPVGLSDSFSSSEEKLSQWKAFLRRTRLTEETPPFASVIRVVHDFLAPVLSAARRTERFAASWEEPGPWKEI